MNYAKLKETVVPEEQKIPKEKCINAENRMFGRCFDCEKAKAHNTCRQHVLDNIDTLPLAVLDEVRNGLPEKKPLIHDINWAEEYNACRKKMLAHLTQLQEEIESSVDNSLD